MAMRKKYEEENGFHENHGDELEERYWNHGNGSYAEYKREKILASLFD